MICVISQPTFMPWLGWFDLADQSDIMVILDDVAFSKRSWQQRNRIRTPNGLEFLTVPVKTSGQSGQCIIECELADSTFIKKMIATLRTNYGRAAFFADAIDTLSITLEEAAIAGRLVDLNCGLITWMASKLDITTPIIRASSLGVAGERGEHLAAICEDVGASQYLSTAGAEAYLTEDKAGFDKRGISIMLHVYDHPTYEQRFAPFMPYACGLDLIFNEGPNAAKIMRAGRRPARIIGENTQNNAKEL